MSTSLKVFAFDGKKYGVVFGDSQFIITETDFVHGVYDSGESVTLNSGYPNHREEKYSVEDLRTLSTDDMDLARFGHYWGIKSRVGANYRGLLESMREIGVSTDNMPKFGDRE